MGNLGLDSPIQYMFLEGDVKISSMQTAYHKPKRNKQSVTLAQAIPFASGQIHPEYCASGVTIQAKIANLKCPAEKTSISIRLYSKRSLHYKFQRSVYGEYCNDVSTYPSHCPALGDP